MSDFLEKSVRMSRRDLLGNEVSKFALPFFLLNLNLADVPFCVSALFPNLRFVVVREKKNHL